MLEFFDYKVFCSVCTSVFNSCMFERMYANLYPLWVGSSVLHTVAVWVRVNSVICPVRVLELCKLCKNLYIRNSTHLWMGSSVLHTFVVWVRVNSVIYPVRVLELCKLCKSLYIRNSTHLWMGSSVLHTFVVWVRVNSIVCLFGLRNCVKCVTKTCVSGRIKHASLFAFCWPITIFVCGYHFVWVSWMKILPICFWDTAKWNTHL